MTTPWTRKFRQHFARNVALLGGKDITMARRNAAKQAAILQIELDRLAEKFAAGPGATPAELVTYDRTAAAIGNLFEQVGIPHTATPRDDQKLVQLLQQIIDSRMAAIRAVIAAGGVPIMIAGFQIVDRDTGKSPVVVDPLTYCVDRFGVVLNDDAPAVADSDSESGFEISKRSMLSVHASAATSPLQPESPAQKQNKTFNPRMHAVTSTPPGDLPGDSGGPEKIRRSIYSRKNDKPPLADRLTPQEIEKRENAQKLREWLYGEASSDVSGFAGVGQACREGKDRLN